MLGKQENDLQDWGVAGAEPSTVDTDRRNMLLDVATQLRQFQVSLDAVDEATHVQTQRPLSNSNF